MSPIYWYQTYTTFTSIFYLGWIVWIAVSVYLHFYIDKSTSPYKDKYQLYLMIICSLLLVIGVVGTIFLPTTEVMKTLLGLK